jgi:hypothetical protein
VRDGGPGVLRIQSWYDGVEEPPTLAPTVIADANMENIQKAKEFIYKLNADGGNAAVGCCRPDCTADRPLL